MQHDLILVIGLVVLVFAIPSAVSSFSEGRAPRVPAIVLLIGGGLLIYALAQKPGGYTLQDIPHAVARVIGHYLR